MRFNLCLQFELQGTAVDRQRDLQQLVAVVLHGADCLTLWKATNSESSIEERCFLDGGLQQGQEVSTMPRHSQKAAAGLTIPSSP